MADQFFSPEALQKIIDSRSINSNAFGTYGSAIDRLQGQRYIGVDDLLKGNVNIGPTATSVGSTFGGPPLTESISLSSKAPKGALTKLKVPRSSRPWAMMDDTVNAIRGIPGKLGGIGGTQYMKNIGKIGGRALPLFIAIDAATELADQNDPFQKNLAEGLGTAGGTIGGAYGGGAIGAALGGPAAPITGTIGAILGAILMSDAGKKLAGGAYTALNPRGELDHYIRQLDKQKEYQLARDSINRELAMTRAKDQQTMDLEAAVLNKLLGN